MNIIVAECGGKMHLRDGRFLDAHTDFFEAFKNYDESGSARRTTCLKYLVLANMLIKSDINPFDSQEAKPFKNEPEIVAMTQMVQAYQDNDIQAFEQIMTDHQDSIMADPFIREHTEELMNNIRTQVLLRLIRPYTNVRISYLSKKLKVSEGEVIDLLVGAILDDGLEAKINEESGMIEMPKNKKKMTVSTLVVPNAGDSAAVKSDSKEGTSSSDGTSSSATQPILSGPPPTSCNQELSLEGLRLWADRIDSIQSSIAVYKKVM
ncbi:hypothetical protein L3Y34_014182 [Caenorhabditis briggsae]|nr:hypothetical protein L3Y34_014182 [Caenorhabditis briggsae]